MIIDFGPVRILSVSPPVFLSGIPYNAYLGIAGAFAERYGNAKAGFVIFPTWTIESPGFPEAIRRAHLEHVELYPNHVFRFIGNTHKEAALLESVGLPGVFLNKNFTVSDQIFHPINAEVEFDAIYNARFVPVKRHELAAAIPRVGYIAYVEQGNNERQEQFRRLFAETLARNPNHVLLNKMVDGLPVGMSQQQVNAAQGRGAVGLLLSGEEGSSYASMEYLLAGIPVVSTPSKGGRDVFFDPEFCIVCKPDPLDVRDAVAAIRARGIPRDVVRARTLGKIEPERERFLNMVDDLIEKLGGTRRYGGGGWPFGDRSGVRWASFKEHLAELA